MSIASDRRTKLQAEARRLRALGWTLNSIAYRIKVSRSTVYNWTKEEPGAS